MKPERATLIFAAVKGNIFSPKHILGAFSSDLVDWFVKNGVAGLFTVCLSSEMYDLSSEERLALARAVKEYAGGRVPVVASGTFGGAVEDMAEFVRSMASEVDAVVVLVNQLAAENESDAVWRVNVQKLLDLTPGIRLGLYECPVPYRRFISPEDLRWAVGTGRFFFHKDTESKKEAIRAKVEAVKEVKGACTSFRFFNANVETLQYSMQLGADGFCGISANICPSLIVWLCMNYDNEKHADRVQTFLGLSQNIINWKYPACAKRYHQLLGSRVHVRCIRDTPAFDDMEVLALGHLRESIADICKQVGIDIC